MVLVHFKIVFHCLDWFGGVFVKKENVGVLKEMLSKFCQDPCSCFIYRLSYNHPNEVILIVKEPYEIFLQMYRRDQEQIVSLRLPNTGIKVSLSGSWFMLCFWYCYSVLAIS